MVNIYINLSIRIPIWYDVKLAFVAWLVLPQFCGAAFIYETFVREKLIKRYGALDHHNRSPNVKGKNKFVEFVTPKKVSLDTHHIHYQKTANLINQFLK